MKFLRGIRRALIVAPHPDDEVIGAANLIDFLVRRRADVRVIIVSDGAASHLQSSSWPRPRLIAERKRESRRALSRLGLHADQIEFLGLPDGRLSELGSASSRRIARAVTRFRGLELLIGPALDDAHPDHRAVATTLSRCRIDAKRLVFRIWPHDYRSPNRSIAIRTSSSSVKRSLIGNYRTQLGAVRDDPNGFAIAAHELAEFAYPVERFEVYRR